MLGLKTVDRFALTALQFISDSEFRRAARRAASLRLPVDVPGRNTLIIRTQDVPVFEGFKFSPVAIADKVSDSDRASLRRRLRQPH